MSDRSFSRCEFMSPVSGLQCERWFEGAIRKYDAEGNMLPTLCEDHANGSLEGDKESFIANQNADKEYAYQFFVNHSEDEGFQLLEEHLAKLEAIVEREKNRIFAVRAVKAEKLANLSESERLERLKYRPEKRQKAATEKAPQDPIAKITKSAEKSGKLISTSKARDLLTMDPDDFIAKYNKKKGS
jgi:hypothetical protein